LFSPAWEGKTMRQLRIGAKPRGIKLSRRVTVEGFILTALS
jgi:hypothetical protein